jgi:NAD(P)H-hydrate epimerase
MSLPQQPSAKYNWHSVYSAKQVLANEGLVAQIEHLAMYELMERAGTAAFNALNRRWSTAKSILVLSGKGNNGGDGFIIARLAHLANMQVTVLVSCDTSKIEGDALTAYQAMLDAGVTDVFSKKLTDHIHDFTGDIIVDALFGIGFYGVLAEPMQQIVTKVNDHAAKVLSVDTPSGLCATTGFVNDNDAVIADVTVTFIVYKQGLLTGQAANFVGDLILAEIGLGTVFKHFLASDVLYQHSYPLLRGVNPLKKRVKTSHKGTIGQVLAIGGGCGMPGAIRLASEASLRCGAALVAVCCHQNNQALVFNGRAELMLAPNQAQQLENSTAMSKASVILLGPGLGQNAWSTSLFDLVMLRVINFDTVNANKTTNKEKVLVLDADALTLLSKTKHFCSRWILTPHPKEAALLLSCDVATIEADRFSAVRNIAQKYGGICILKGAGSLISDGKQVVINSTGNAGMASGGMGDVLSGIVAALVLQMDDYFMATCLAVYIHGAAGDIIANSNGQRGMLASDLFAPLQKLVN